MEEERLVGQAYEAALDSKQWSVFASDLGIALGSAAVVLSLGQSGPDDPGELIATGLEGEFLESYKRRYIALDPFRTGSARLPVGIVAFGHELISETALRETEFYRDWMEPQGFLPRLFLGGVVDRDADWGISVIGVFQRRGARPLGRAQQRLGQCLMPHLRRAVQIHLRGARLEAERRALATAFDRLPIGLILVDQRGRVVATNRAADHLLAQRDGLSLDRDGLGAAWAQETCALRRLLAAAARSDASLEAGRPVGLVLRRPSGRRPLEAAVVGARGAGADGGSERGWGLAALFVSDPEEGVEAPDELLRELYSLTPAEGALARELSSGRTLEVAAQRLDITIGTARQRLAQIFNKTGTRRQAALVRLMLIGPAELRWDEGEDALWPPL